MLATGTRGALAMICDVCVCSRQTSGGARVSLATSGKFNQFDLVASRHSRRHLAANVNTSSRRLPPRARAFLREQAYRLAVETVDGQR